MQPQRVLALPPSANRPVPPSPRAAGSRISLLRLRPGSSPRTTTCRMRSTRRSGCSNSVIAGPRSGS